MASHLLDIPDVRRTQVAAGGAASGPRWTAAAIAASLIRLREKGGTLRWQPVSPTLASRLADHADHRGALAPGDALLRYRNGRPLTSRRYDHLWQRLGQQLPWVATHGISIHWLRHTTLTWVERHYGYGTARAYAGHTDSTGPATTTYIKADLHAVATALAAMTGQPHPLATPLTTAFSTARVPVVARLSPTVQQGTSATQTLARRPAPRALIDRTRRPVGLRGEGERPSPRPASGTRRTTSS